jgi:hypothetical protein
MIGYIGPGGRDYILLAHLREDEVRDVLEVPAAVVPQQLVHRDLGINPIVTLEKQLLNMIGNLVKRG